MPRKSSTPVEDIRLDPGPTSTPTSNPTSTQSTNDVLAQLAAVLTQVLQQNKPVEKKTTANRIPRTPWSPKNGEPKLKLKRKFYQHNYPLDAKRMTNERIALANQLKPGRFCDGFVTVTRRRDKGINITWPLKTPDQKLFLVQNFGLRNLDEIMQYCIDEAKNPKKTVEIEDEE